LAERCFWEAEALGSNPSAPTNKLNLSIKCEISKGKRKWVQVYRHMS
jgi:hypothetical protein